MIFSRLTSTPAPSSGKDETPTRHKDFPGRRKQSGVPIDTSTAKTLGGPGRSAGHRSPCPIKAKKKKQTSLIREVTYQHLYLVTGRADHRSQTCTWRPKTKLKLFERASLRLFTKQTTGTPDRKSVV